MGGMGWEAWDGVFIGDLGSHEEVVLDHVMFFLGDAIACALALASDFRLDMLY